MPDPSQSDRGGSNILLSQYTNFKHVRPKQGLALAEEAIRRRLLCPSPDAVGLFAFAGVWTEFRGDRGAKSRPDPRPSPRLRIPDDLAERGG
jgi:hypothetical protein